VVGLGIREGFIWNAGSQERMEAVRLGRRKGLIWNSGTQELRKGSWETRSLKEDGVYLEVRKGNGKAGWSSQERMEWGSNLKGRRFNLELRRLVPPTFPFGQSFGLATLRRALRRVFRKSGKGRRVAGDLIWKAGSQEREGGWRDNGLLYGIKYEITRDAWGREARLEWVISARRPYPREDCLFDS
jgi:hypothetical protein